MKSRFEVVRYSEKWFHLLLIIINTDGWKLIALFDIQIVFSDTNHAKEKVKSVHTADSWVAAQAD